MFLVVGEHLDHPAQLRAGAFGIAALRQQARLEHVEVLRLRRALERLVDDRQGRIEVLAVEQVVDDDLHQHVVVGRAVFADLFQQGQRPRRPAAGAPRSRARDAAR